MNVKELAEQTDITMTNVYACYEKHIERFAELVRQDEREVNAVLLEALKEIASETYDEWTNGAKAQRIAQAAIAKAEEQA